MGLAAGFPVAAIALLRDQETKLAKKGKKERP